MNYRLLALNVGGAFLTGAALFFQGTWANGHVSWPTVIVGAVCAGLVGAGHYLQGVKTTLAHMRRNKAVLDSIQNAQNFRDRETPVEIPHMPPPRGE